MSVWSAIVKAVNSKSVHQQVKAAGELRHEEGWFYKESQDFSRSQSTIRIDQRRPGNWQALESSCGVAGLNKPARQKEVAGFFAGSYRWLRLERELNGFTANNVIKVIGTYRDKSGKELSAHLGFLELELADDLERENVFKLWARIRFIKFPSAGPNSRHVIRFDLMKNTDPRKIA